MKDKDEWEELIEARITENREHLSGEELYEATVELLKQHVKESD